MKIKGQFTHAQDLIDIAKKFNGCYGEYQYSKAIHKELIEMSDGWKKNNGNEREYWKDINSEYTEWRLILR